MTDKCPMCGAMPVLAAMPTGEWACGSYVDYMGTFRESKQCLRNQLARLQAIIDKLRKVVFEATSIHLKVEDASKISIPLWMALTELAEKAEVAIGNRPPPSPNREASDE